MLLPNVKFAERQKPCPQLLRFTDSIYFAKPDCKSEGKVQWCEGYFELTAMQKLSLRKEAPAARPGRNITAVTHSWPPLKSIWLARSQSVLSGYGEIFHVAAHSNLLAIPDQLLRRMRNERTNSGWLSTEIKLKTIFGKSPEPSML